MQDRKNPIPGMKEHFFATAWALEGSYPKEKPNLLKIEGQGS